MAPFKTWLIAGFLGALCATLWLGAFAFGEPRLWNVALSLVTFIAGIALLTWKLRPSQVAHAVPASSVGYAIGWDVVQGTDAQGVVGLNPYLVAIMAVALATFVAVVVSKVQDGRAAAQSDGASEA